MANLREQTMKRLYLSSSHNRISTEEESCINTSKSTEVAEGKNGRGNYFEKEEVLPPDGGWGWMVAIGCFLVTSLLTIVGPCFGMLFSSYLLGLGTSSTTTAWIFNSHCFIWNVMGLISRPLTLEFGWRTIGVTGAFLTAMALVASAFAPNAEFLFFSFSALCGLGGGTVVCICFTILPYYFDKHRGVANSMMMAGICLGQILAPPLIQYLQEEYGFKGATLIIGAIMLNACIGASFFHPVSWHTKRAKKVGEEASVVKKEDLDPLVMETNRSLKKSQSLKSFGKDVGEKEVYWLDVIKHTRNLRINDERRLSEASRLSMSSLAVSTLDMAGLGAMYTEEKEKESSAKRDHNNKNSVLGILARVAKSTLSDLRFLRSPRALIISLGATFCINGYINFIMMVPFAMQVAGHSLESSAYCISVSAICNLLMRLSVSCMSDWPRFNVKACYVSGFVVIFISNLVFPFLNDLQWMLVTMAFWGCGVGMNMGVYNLVMISVMGLDNLAPVFGSSCFMVALGFITSGPIIGIIRDASGSYSTSMWVVSAMISTSIILWIFMPAAQAYDRRKEQEKGGQGEEQDKA